MPVKVGVISDTHGLMRPEALTALAGSELIIHAGDVGSREVLQSLAAIAPLHSIRGNIDTQDWAAEIPETMAVEVEHATLWVLHDLNRLDLDPVAGGFQAVISGHSHKPKIEEKNGVLYLNPGSAGPRRFRLPVTVARCEVDGESIRAELVELHV